MQTTQFRIDGMNCAACVGHVTRALEGVPGVHAVQVDLAAGRAAVEHDETADVARMLEAVREADYEAKPMGPVAFPS